MRLTTNVIFTLSTLIVCAPSHAQIFTFTREQMIKYTANNPFERFEDGRPKAPDALLEKVKDLSAEDHERLNGYVARVLQKGALSRETLLGQVRDLVAASTHHGRRARRPA